MSFLHRCISGSRNPLRQVLVLAVCAGTLISCSSKGSNNGANSITIGLLLPFTGSSSGTAANFERAALYAADRVNAGGGVHGRPIRILSADTHSDLQSAESSVETLVNAGAVAIVGPESSDIAAEIGPYLSASGVAFVSPLVGAANGAAVDCSTPWFRLAPSAQALGEALAKLAIANQVTSIALMYAQTSYDQALGDALRARFTALNGVVETAIALNPAAQSYAKQVESALSADADAIVLTSSPQGGALIVDEFDALSTGTPRWFLCPELKTDLLVQNVAPEALEGARGVAPKIYDTTQDFPNAFAQRWQGDQPLEGAYFYYDAVALLAFGLSRATDSTDASPLQSLNSGVHDAAAPPGEAVGWNEIERGLTQLNEGAAIYYSGLTGPLLFDSCGARALGATTTWEVHAGRIIDDAN